MNEEELFCKLFPEYVVNGKPLSPYFDLFESGFEQAEKRIEELEKENAEFKEQLYAFDEEREKLRKENAELKRIVKMVAMINKGIYTNEGIKAIYAEAEQFLKEE